MTFVLHRLFLYFMSSDYDFSSLTVSWWCAVSGYNAEFHHEVIMQLSNEMLFDRIHAAHTLMYKISQKSS
jgi:hypothetical protein